MLSPPAFTQDRKVMKLTASLCVVAVCLYASLPSTRAQVLSCESGSEIGSDVRQLLDLLQESPTVNCKDEMLALVQVTDYLAEAQTVFTALAVVCQPTCLEYVRSVAEKCVPSYVNVLGHACAKNEQQYNCYQTVGLRNGTDVLMQCFPERFQPSSSQGTELSSNDTTTPSPVPSFSCSNECRESLESFRAWHGCCITNAFNSTTFGLMSLNLANYSLWSTCGVETIDGFCPLPFNATLDGDVTTTVAMTTLPPTLGESSSLRFAAHSLLTLLSLLMVFLVLF